MNIEEAGLLNGQGTMLLDIFHKNCIQLRRYNVEYNKEETVCPFLYMNEATHLAKTNIPSVTRDCFSADKSKFYTDICANSRRFRKWIAILEQLTLLN